MDLQNKQCFGGDMKKLLLVLPLTLAVAAAAQTTKPSAAVERTTSTATTTAPAQERAMNTQPETTDLSLPPGTPVYMKLETPISTQVNRMGDRFAGRVTQPVVLNSKTIIPVGAALEGRVLRAEEMRRVRGTPVIELRPELITMPDGTRYSIIATIVDTSNNKDVNVDDEGRIHGRGHDGSDWKETGIATGAGAGIGTLVGGGKGFLVGAGIGATASVVRWLSKTRSADLPAGTEIVMELSRPMSLSSSSAGK
jgi:hypothetical protein